MASSGIGLVLLMPMILVAGIAIKLTSRGQMFYTQNRVGRNGKLFKVKKFRTMFVGGEKFGTITTVHDNRITPVGRWLRRFKLDEYPQLLNVFNGKMSLVGPRPDVPGYSDKLMGRAQDILKIRPGITGPATLYFRNEEELLGKESDPKNYNDEVVYPAKIALNMMYLDRWSFFRDIGFIFITLFPMLDRFFGLIPSTDIEILAQEGKKACQ